MMGHNRAPRPVWSHSVRSGRVLMRVVISAAAIAVLAGSAIAWRAYSRNGSLPGRNDRTLEIQAVTRASFDITTSSSGELEAKNQIEVRSELETTSTIAEVIEEGKTVKKGDLLVRLNSDQLQNEITELNLKVESAKSDLEKAETAVKIQDKENSSKISQAKLKVTLAELAYKQWDEGDRVQKTRDYTQAIEKATQEKDRLAEKFEKCVELEKKGYVSTDQMKRDKLEYEDSVRALDKAKLTHEIYLKYEMPKDQASKQSDVEQAKEELDRVQDQAAIELRSKESARHTASRTLEMHQDKLKNRMDQLAKATIKAPADGLVVYATSMERSRWGWGGDGPLQVGRQVHPNETLIILPDTTEMVASVRVHETLASRIKEGLAATVKIDAVGGRTFAAKVLSIGILSESNGWRDPNLREYTVKLAVSNPDKVELKPSMRTESEIVMGHVDDAISTPIQAVYNDGMLRYVHVQSPESPSKYVRRPIKLGRVSETLGEVTAGLAVGDRILLRKPTPGEVMDREFSETELTSVGLKRDPAGRIARIEDPSARAAKGPPKSDKPAIKKTTEVAAADPSAVKADPGAAKESVTPTETDAEAKPATGPASPGTTTTPAGGSDAK